MENFDYDLTVGQEKETEFAMLFDGESYIVSSTKQKGEFSDYDVEVLNPVTGYVIKFEVKHDRLAPNTNNVMVELNKTVDGEIQPSGLSATKADIYVYKFPADRNFYAIDVAELREMINKGNYKFRCSGGDGNRSNLVGMDFKTFKKHSVKINEQYFNE